MERIKPRTLSGFRDRLPGDSLQKERLIHQLTATFRAFGFAPIETPHLEYAETLIHQGGEEIKKEIYRFQDHGERDVALRFDLTVPLARFVSQHKNDLGLPFKRYAIANVFRGERAQAGRYREFTQCDFDCIGSTPLTTDAEIIQMIHASLLGIGIQNFTISINHRQLLDGLCAQHGLESHTQTILRIIDKLEKIGEEKVKEELQKAGVSKASATAILHFTQHQGFGFDFIEQAKPLCQNDSMAQSLESLREVLTLLESGGVDLSRIKIDFSIARGLGYYTGIVYETKLNDCPEMGSISSGGRYDNLTQTFSSEPMPGVGASIGLDRLLAALEKLGQTDSSQTPADVLIVTFDAALMPYAYAQAHQLRNAGINTETYPIADKLKKQLSYANRKGHRFAILIGEDEAKEQSVTLKNLESGEQHEKVPLDSAIEIIQTINKENTCA